MAQRTMRHPVWIDILGWIGFVLVLFISLTHALGAHGNQTRGQRIFDGQEPLLAKIEGHQENLPASFAKCINCHANSAPPHPGPPLETRTAPLLSQANLIEIQSRRGGPPFAYDRNSFCRTLQTGVDPQSITLARAMPRFAVNQAQCIALWIYLINEQGRDGYQSR